MRAMERRRLALGIAALVAVFALGFLSARLLAPAPPPPPSTGDAAPASTLPWPSTDGGLAPFVLDAGAVSGPKILFDPDSIQLLPDASLRLDLPPGFDDAGAPE